MIFSMWKHQRTKTTMIHHTLRYNKWLLIIGLVAIASHISSGSTIGNGIFDIHEYVYGVDDDLQAQVQISIETERLAGQSNWHRDEMKSNNADCITINESPCPPSKYRTPSGVCNNVRHPSWGARSSPYLKFLSPAYADGLSRPRQSSSSHGLPTAHEIISQFERANSRKSHRIEERKALTSLTGTWAELILRDISAPVFPQLDLSRCCNQLDYFHPECFASFEPTGQCKPYYRNVPSRMAYGCKFANREQMNGASGYLDGSDIYGNTDDKLHKIRTYKDGLVDITMCENCNDNRSKIGQLYSLLLKEHNRIAKQFSIVNGHWDDAKLFFEARRAVVAQIQRITFQEFTPSILGESDNGELEQINSGFYHGYSSSNRPGAFDAVILSVLPTLTSLSNNNQMENVTIQYQIEEAANRISLDISPSLMIPDWNATALLIQLGRDHGLPSYTSFMNRCTSAMINRYITPEDRILLENIYGNINNVDLLVGGIVEKPSEGSALGPTFSCLLAGQLAKIRNSDRFWYENDIPPSSFNREQLSAIRRTSFAGLLCANSNISIMIQPMAFIQSDAYLNSKIDCDKYAPLDLTAWKDHNDDQSDENIKKYYTTNPKVNITKNNQDNNDNGVKILDNTRESVNLLKIRNQVFTISPDIINAALKKAQRDLVIRKRLEYNSWLEQRYADPKSPVGTAASFSKANKDALLLANSSILYELATNEIINGVQGLQRRKRQIFENTNNILGGFSGSEFSDVLQNVDLTNFLPNTKATNHDEIDCPNDESPCDPTTSYRTHTGHCNNLRNPKLGKSLTTFARLLPPVYEDGVSKPRVSSVTGASLPNPRTISTTIHPDISNLHNRYTLMVMQFAQFLDHDLTMTPIHKGFAESIPSCRSCDSARTVHPECNPFTIPPGDHFYPTHNVTTGERLCFPSMRSLPGQQHLGPREQVNQNTAFLDASVIYGENICIANVLRSFNGRMNITSHPINRLKDLLPQSATHPECRSPSGYCFIGGDGRASEQPGLTVMHTIWVREHNRIMEELRRINAHWDGEKMYQETRRIISAMIQHISYNEFLPRILGWNAVSLYGLKLLPQGYYREYSPTCNPSILTEFATAAYRIGHSLLRPHLPRMDANYRPVDPPILLRDGFFNVDMLYRPEMIDEMLRGLTATPMETLDQFITGEVTNHLFEHRNIPHSGIDLIALNIQRGRDHGIPGYNNYRALCNLKRATNFDDLSREMAPEVIARLKRVYATVDDIDLFPGGMSERPLQGGLIGPTFGCIIAIQMRQLRKCDRFWYETDDPNIRFTEQQLAEIRKTTLAKLICENMDSHVEMQRAVFDLPSNFLNPRVLCGSMAHMDLSAWKETRSTGCQIAGRNVAVGESGFPSPCTSCVCTNEGTQCASLRVTDCNRLLREASREAILRDDVCTAQCGFALAASEPITARQSSFASASASTFAFATSGPRQLPSFSGFKLPDLSQFVA